MSPHLLRSPARLASASLLRVQSDERLVAFARDGHERAFEAIVERYRPALERYAARLVGPSRGEDAVQQAFVNAHRALIGDSEKAIELKPWLYRIVHNTALNTLRATRDEQYLGDEAERLPLVDDVMERRERLREALDAVAALPEKQRDAILLRELEGRSHDEIAVALGLSAGAARQQIFRARAALRAAATAITPTPLLLRMLEMSASSAANGGGDLAMGAGAGLTAVIAKAGAGVLVTGAVVGGAVGTGVVPSPAEIEHHYHANNPAVVQNASESGRTTTEEAELTAMEDTRGDVAEHHRSGASAVGRHHGAGSHAGRGSNGAMKVVVKRTATGHHSFVTEHVTHHTETHHTTTTETHHSGHHGETETHHSGGTDSAGNEAAGDVSGKPANAGDAGGGKPVGGGGGGNKGGGAETAPAPAPGPATSTAPVEGAPATAPAGGGGGGGGGGGTSGGGGGTVSGQAVGGSGGKG